MNLTIGAKLFLGGCCIATFLDCVCLAILISGSSF